MYILGIHHGIDATAALIRNGEIIAIVSEERLSRKKLHTGFPYQSIPEVLKIADISASQVDTIAFSFNDYMNGNPLFTNFLLNESGGTIDLENKISWLDILREILRQLFRGQISLKTLSLSKRSSTFRDINISKIKKILVYLGFSENVKIDYHDHHHSHAANAYYTSGFEKGLIVTADGCGDGVSLTVNHVIDGKIKRRCSSDEEISVGKFYGAITAYLGFKMHRHEGKTTGLAAYGDPIICYNVLSKCIELSDDKNELTTNFGAKPSLFSTLLWLGKLLTGNFIKSRYEYELIQYFKKHLKQYSREDIAAAAQFILEDVVCELVRKSVEETGLKKIALSGGVFANVKLNQRIAELENVESVFIHPDMGDGGLALGGAYLSHTSIAKDFNPKKLNDVYFGPSYDDESILDSLRKYNVPYERVDRVEPILADYLSKGKIIGHFYGRMEYGPRALGNRTIFCQPTDKIINQELNNRLGRTEFMPFAPIVMHDRFFDYFDCDENYLYPSRFMTITCKVKDICVTKAPAITHIDNTARPQVISEKQNMRVYNIIKEYNRLTGIPVLINTSFNIHEEPIVCTPDDAICSFLVDCVDILCMNDFICRKK